MTEPTDAELGKLAEECGIGWAAGLGGMDDFLRAFSNAVLAKWGTPQPSPAPLSESIDQVERALAIIGVVGAIDGYDVVRRESVLEIARRTALAAQGGKA